MIVNNKLSKLVIFYGKEEPKLTFYIFSLVLKNINYFAYYQYLIWNWCVIEKISSCFEEFLIDNIFFKFLDCRFVAVSTDNGIVKLYRVIGENEAPNVHLEEAETWDSLHSFGYDFRFVFC